MQRLTDNKIVLVTRPTRLAELVIRFNTVSQARFYIEHQGADFSDYLCEDETYHRALSEAQATLAQIGRVQVVDRGFLPNFVFAPDDTVVTLGQDGLVANTLKYLNGQPVVGVNPDPERWDGRLLPFRVSDLPKVMPEVVLRKRPTRSVTMAKAALNNGQTLYGVNDLFIGPKTHCSARYLIRSGEASETQSSSGVIVSTGMGSTGWLKSLLTGAAAITQSAANGNGFGPHRPPDRSSRRKEALTTQVFQETNEPRNLGCYERIVTEFAWDANYLFYTVREPFPTKTTGASLVFGRVTDETPLILESRMAENGVIFSDGIERDFLEFNSGTKAVIGIADGKVCWWSERQDMRIPFFNELEKAQNILIAGAGGGFDVFCGLPLYFWLKNAGRTVHLANLSSGALGFSDAENPTSALWRITPKTAASKYFPEMHLSRWLTERYGETPVYAIEPSGARRVSGAYEWLAQTLQPDAIVLVDGGTDSLMRGDEAGLATPEGDAVSLLAAHAVPGIPHKLLLCLGFGVDAHHGICHAHFLENVAALSRDDAYLGAWSLAHDSEEFQLYRDACEFTFARLPQQPSIVNTSIIAAVAGSYGDIHPTERTEGSSLFINPLMGLYWSFHLDGVVRRNLYIDQIRNTETAGEVALIIERFRDSLPKTRPWTTIPC